MFSGYLKKSAPKQTVNQARIVRSPGVNGGKPSTSTPSPREPTSSGQVQQSYWRPTTPDKSPIRSPVSATHFTLPSSQMRQQEFICTSPQPQGLPATVMSPPPKRDVHKPQPYDMNQNIMSSYEPVWRQFKYYEHCATSDL